MQRLILLGIFLISINFSCSKGKNNPDSCNGKSTRREVKLATDEAADLIDTTVIITSVDSLGGLDLIKSDGDTKRQEIEKSIFSVTAKVDKLKKYRDGDWKVKLISENENYLNCEAPNPGCEYASESPYFEQFSAVKDWIDANQDEIVGKTVTVVGIAFIDIPHGYPRNAAENNIELHPILDIHF